MLSELAPMWAWAPWPFATSARPDLVADALTVAGLATVDKLGNTQATHPDAPGRIQTVMWDAHYRGGIADGKHRVVSTPQYDLDPIVVVGAPDGLTLGHDIAEVLNTWAQLYGIVEPEATNDDPTPTLAMATPMAYYPAWACGHCGWVARGTAERPIPVTQCARCHRTDKWRQPTPEELASVDQGITADEQARIDAAVQLQTEAMRNTPPEPAQRLDDYGFVAATGPAPQAFAQQHLPDHETTVLVDILYLLNSLPDDARKRILRYVKKKYGG